MGNYYRDEVNDGANENNAVSYRIDNTKVVRSESFEYKTKIIRSTPADNNTLIIHKKSGVNFGDLLICL